MRGRSAPDALTLTFGLHYLTDPRDVCEKTAYEEIRPHPFITQCYGFFQDELSLYLLLELCVMDLFELLQLHADHQG